MLMVAGYYRDGVLAANAVEHRQAAGPERGLRGRQRCVRPPAVPGEAGAAGEGFFDANYRPT